MVTYNMVTRPRSVAESHAAWGALSSQPDEITLPGWLNAALGTTSYKRVVYILKLICETEQKTQLAWNKGAYVPSVRPGAKEKWPPEKIKLQREAHKAHAELQNQFGRYRFEVRLTNSLAGGWLLNMYCPRQRNDFAWKNDLIDVCEGDAVLAAARLAERSLLGRVRLCARCSKKWLYAKHRNYIFCSRECREAYYTQTDEYRQKKARQMRECRDRQRRREETERSVAAFRNSDEK
jgi:hypothetical protein